MKLAVISSAPFLYKKDTIVAYSPYLKEMALWAKHADQVAFCCPIWETENGLLVTAPDFAIDRHFKLQDFNLKSFANICKTLFFLPYNSVTIFRAMIWADHIHLRCPGNIGLLGSVTQLFFPSKVKTAKYAGNWDSKSDQPVTYRLQKWILNTPFLTKKMQLLVYGNWPDLSKNGKSFFTATYGEKDKLPLLNLNYTGTIHFVFAGMLTKGKNPLYAIQLVERLSELGFTVELTFFGDGIERNSLEDYVKNKAMKIIFFEGNQDASIVKEAFRKSHFVVLPSESEGWPKVVAEGMFWGCVPISTPVSCVPFMLDYGKRGLVLTMELEPDVVQITQILQKESDFQLMRTEAANWSRMFTTDKMESEIKKLLQS